MLGGFWITCLTASLAKSAGLEDKLELRLPMLQLSLWDLVYHSGPVADEKNLAELVAGAGPDSQHPSLTTVPQLKQISPTSNYTSRNTSKIIQVHMCHGPFLGYKRQKSHTDLLLAKFAKLSENLWFLFFFIHCLVLFWVRRPSFHQAPTYEETHTTKLTLVTSPQASLCQLQTKDNGMTFGQTSSHGIQIHRHFTSLENLPGGWDRDAHHGFNRIKILKVPNRFWSVQRRPSKEGWVG